jgi:hypothetical protein
MNSSKSGFKGWLIDNCYIIFSVLAFLTFYYDTPDIIRPVLLLGIAFLNIRTVKMGKMNRVVIFYFFAAFISLTGSLIRPYPISFFLTDMYWAYLPIIFYFIGNKSSDDYPIFYERSLWAFMFIFIVGFYFLVSPTERYISKTIETLNLHSQYNEGTYMYARFASFMDSYHTSNLGVCSLCFSFGLMKFCSREKLLIRLFAIIAIAISFVTIMLAQQRVAMYISVIILIYYLIANSSKNKFGGIVTIIVLGVLMALAINYYLSFFGEDFLNQITGRFSQEKSSTLVSSRSNQWIEAFDGFLMEPLFGLGVGSGGHLAAEIGLKPIVTDGSYSKVLLEGGLFSFIPFIIILISTLIKGFKQRKKYYVEFPLLFFFSCSMIGANVIDMPYIIMFMWYIIGRINSNNSRKQLAFYNNGQR